MAFLLLKFKNIVLINIILFFNFNCFGGKKIESTNLNDSLYSKKIESIINEIKLKYGNNYQDSLYNHFYYPKLDNDLIGFKFDDFNFTDVQGNNVALANFKIPIIVESTASWCKPCIALIPIINQLSVKYFGKIKFILITQDTGTAAIEFSKKFGENVIVIPSDSYRWPNELIKSKANNFINICSFPTTLFIDKFKIIRDISSGAVTMGSYKVEKRKIVITKQEANNQNVKRLTQSINKLF